MKQKLFGKTGWETSPVSFGAMRVQANEKGVSEALLYALEKGVNFIDTARNYGESETIVGATLREWNGDRPFIATKVKPLDISNWRFYVPIEEQFTRASIIESVETSLRELGVDSLDLVQLHQWYYLWGQSSEWLETLHELKQQGKLRFIGVSAQDHEHDAILNLVDENVVDAVQIYFNAFETRPATSVFPLCEQRQVGTILRCVYDHSGSLAVGARREVLAKDVKLANASPEIVTEYIERINALELDMKKYGLSLAELAIRLPLSLPGVGNIAASMSSAKRVDQALAAAEAGPLPSDIVERVIRNHVWIKNFYYFSKSTVDGNSTKPV